MPRAEPQAALSVERFFQLALLGLVSSGYLAVAGSGYLDTPTILLTTTGLFIRALLICGILRFTISERTTTILTLAYSAFFLLDYLVLSREFLPATVHLLFFLAVMKILTARTNRDYLYTAVIAFLELLAAAILSSNFNFFLFLALYLVFAIATLSSAEIRRSMHRNAVTTARVGSRRFAPRLTLLALFVTAGILLLTAGLFFLLPRTAEAAISRLAPHRSLLPGFATQVTLGEIGEIKTSSRPVMHVSIYSSQRVPGLKWRGGALTEFDGKRWTNPAKPTRIDIEDDHIQLVSGDHPYGRRISYDVNLEAIQNDELFFPGTPEFLHIRSRALYRSPEGVYSLGKALTEGFRYDASSLLEELPEFAPLLSPPPVLSLAERTHNLQLPPLDPRVGDLARAMTAGAPADLERARAIERHLRTDFSYTLELPSRETSDPLAYFLFTRRKGHCEYFASAMAVMLRSIGVPARLATGFQSGIYNDVTDLWLIRAGDAHSWVEAWIPGHGWTTFDPTPPDPNQHVSSLLTRLSLYLDATETFWRDWVVTYDIARQSTLAYRAEQSARRMGIRWFDAVVAVRDGWNKYVIGGARRFGMPIVWTAVAAFLAWVLGRPLLRLFRMRRRVERVRRGEASVGDATLLYRRMLEILGKRGYHKPAWFTPTEFAASLPVGPLAVAVAEFTTTYNAMRFGGHMETASRLSVLLDRMEHE
jgi:transglutaminase-like putative cysteine protease